jgi:uncharacterized membrane protein YidH (DUF202 family)
MHPSFHIPEGRRDARIADPRVAADSGWERLPEDELVEMQTNGERLLLATMQCSLSLIGFGFTIYQIFGDAAARTGFARASLLANRVGISLLGLGIILLSGGLWANAKTGRQLAARRAQLAARGLLPPTPGVTISPVFVVASLLLLVALTILGVIGAHLLR